MTTVHSRIQVTPNEELLAALDRAAERWPKASRSELVLRLALAGDRSRLDLTAHRTRDRQRALQRLQELGAEIYDPQELENLRADWR